jgi:NADPH:quinone reductase-like Zn-dependent oxidoreductase
MKAIVYEKYGSPDVLQLKELVKHNPKSNEVLIKVFASTVTKYDCWARSSTAPPGFGLLSRISSGIRKPKQPILGTELAGEIESVGGDVKRFKKGDQVFAFLMNLGAYAEYVCIPEDGFMALKPTNMTYEEAAAAVQGGLTALYFLRKENIQRGHKVLVFGASGGIGTYAVQLAKYFGAEVTGVCSTSKMEMVKSLGAHKVIDYTKEDFTKNNQTYDIIFDTVGKTSISRTISSLKENGRYIFATFGLPMLIQVFWLLRKSDKKAIIGVLEERPEDLVFLKKLIEAGEIKPVIDRRYALEQTAEAHRFVETGQKKGSVIITMGHKNKT